MIDRYVMTESLPVGESGLEPVVVELRKKLRAQTTPELHVIVFTSEADQIYGMETSEGLPIKYDKPSTLFPDGTACLCYDSGESETPPQPMPSREEMMELLKGGRF